MICLTLLPATRWVEFSTGSEQLVVAAALETQRDGSWERRLVPTMAGEPRLRKPPLTTWLAMAVVPTGQARELAGGPIDDGHFASVAMRIRGVALLLGVLTLLGTYELARVLSGGDRPLGLIALAVCGSTFFFAEQFSRMTTDVVLATTVVWANVALAQALLRGRRWCLVAAGALLGLSFLAKGPVGLLMTLAPLAVLPVVARVGSGRAPHEDAGLVPGERRPLTPRVTRSQSGSAPHGNAGLRPIARRVPLPVVLALSVVAFLAIALPWFAVVLAIEPAAWGVWTTEVARTDATVPESDPWAYLVFPLLTGPWVIFTVLGLVVGLAEVLRRTVPGAVGWLTPFRRVRGPGLVWALLMVVIPILVMSLFRDRKDRYLLPLIPPAAILASVAVRMVLADLRWKPLAARLVLGGHALLLLVLAVGMPIATMLLPRDEYADPSPWLPATVAIPLALAGLVLWLAFAWWFTRPRPPQADGLQPVGVSRTTPLVAGTLTLFLLTTNVFLAGYATSREAQADLKPIASGIRENAADARLWHAPGHLTPGLLIYVGDVVRPMPDDLDPTQRHVLVVRQRRADVDPEPTMPEPWRVLATARRDRSVWWAFVRDPASP